MNNKNTYRKNKDLTDKEKIESLAEKNILYKPFIIKKLYTLSTPKRKEIVENTYKKYNSTKKRSKKEKLKIKRDMIYCRIHYNLNFNEYFMLGFDSKNKSHLKRKNFITNRNRNEYLCLLGTKEGYETLKDKYKTYCLLKPFFKRDIIKLDNEKDVNIFKNYIKKHPIFVKKPINESFGKGIELIDSTKYKNKTDLFNVLKMEFPLILEEQIIQNKKMASLHSNSLNTLRVVTYLDEKGKITIHMPFIKIGQKGSFVDNGGSGGILAQIDPKNGTIITDGKDELNNTYVKHPDTNIIFKGFEIPEWNEVIKLVTKAANEFTKTRYIGWDVGISKDNGPVIVEANGKTQFIGQQITDEIGKRKNLEKLINYKKLKKKNKNYEKW